MAIYCTKPASLIQSTDLDPAPLRDNVRSAASFLQSTCDPVCQRRSVEVENLSLLLVMRDFVVQHPARLSSLRQSPGCNLCSDDEAS